MKDLEQEKQAKVWECKQGEPGTFHGVSFVHQGHGIIEPYYGESSKRYYADTCPCQKEARIQYEEQEKLRERAQRLLRRQEATFQCLGYQWSDMGLIKKTFGNFSPGRQSEAFEMTQAFLGLLKGTLVLHGSYGTGKTHLLAALCNALIGQKKECVFVTVPSLFNAVQSRIAQHQDYFELLDKMKRPQLLVLDDIDKAKWSEFREEIYFAILDARVKQELPTAVSTNRLAELSQFVGGACASRLSIGQIAIEMVGKDYREEI